MQWSELKEGQVVRLMASRHRLSLTGYPLKEAMVCFFGCFFSVLYRIFCTCKVIKPVYICHVKDAQAIPQKSTLQHLSGIEIWDLTRSFQFFNPFFGEWVGVLNKIYILGTYCSYRDNALLVFQMCLLFIVQMEINNADVGDVCTEGMQFVCVRVTERMLKVSCGNNNSHFS